MSARPLAPEFPAVLQWINTPPVMLARQRGRVVVLAFWHAGSPYCHNLLADVAFVQGKHADGCTAIGIHCPKFEAERHGQLALRMVNRLGLRFAVAHDPDFVLWQHYGIGGWPTTVVIDTERRVRDVLIGDLRRDALDAAVARLLEEAGAEDRRVYEVHGGVQRPESRHPLSFPSGLAATRHHLYVSDSGRHRILECSHDGRILRQFGSGNPGFLDGGSAEAGFQHPRGIALTRDCLLVADTGNHALRRVRLLDGDVDTLAGNGLPGAIGTAVAEGRSSALPLNAPWDVAAGTDRLYVACAGGNQICELDMVRRTLRAIAGSGALGVVDGNGYAAAFAAPAAMALVQQTLYVADAAASAIRCVQLANGGVQTLVGQGLLDFGDADGSRQVARLQYPTGLALDPRQPLLWVADTYNNLLKMLRLGGGELRSYDVDYRLHQPGALAALPDALLVANTNAHEVLRVDVASGSVRRLPIGE